MTAQNTTAREMPLEIHAELSRLLEEDQATAVRETHSAIVVLFGDRAYKVKKPVDLGFLDFRDVESRRAVCLRELALNRRLAPDVYLDVATVTGSDGVPSDYLVVMRRMPESVRLATMIRSGIAVEDHVRRLARLLARFHAGAARGTDITAEGSAEALLGRWHANLLETERFRGGLLDASDHAELADLVERYVTGRTPLLAERGEQGLVVDGHGDLIADDVFCLPDEPRVLDCLEFDDRLRWLDVLDDAGFMAMDLERLGRADLAAEFLRWYSEYSGWPYVRSLAHHYISYRAFVRAKVSCLRAAQGDRSSIEGVTAYVQLALAHARAAEVRLVLVGGAPGSGKSTLAAGLADRLGGVLLSTDRVRRELAGVAAADRYTDEGKRAAYDELLRRAADALGHGETVVLDATWGDPATRAAAAAVANRTSSRLNALDCRVDPDVAVERARRRLAAGSDSSEAGAEVARLLALSRADWPDATGIGTGVDPEMSLAVAWACLTGAGA
jgi:aminoglycoside phosphotransferase family enzyme/predicted kinase